MQREGARAEGLQELFFLLLLSSLNDVTDRIPVLRRAEISPNICTSSDLLIFTMRGVRGSRQSQVVGLLSGWL